MKRLGPILVVAIIAFLLLPLCAAQSPSDQKRFDDAAAKRFQERKGLIRGVGAIVSTDSPFRFIGDAPEFAVGTVLESSENQVLSILSALPPRQPVLLYVVLPSDLDADAVRREQLQRIEHNHLFGTIKFIDPQSIDAVIGNANDKPYALIEVTCQVIGDGYLAIAELDIQLNGRLYQRSATGIAMERAYSVPLAICVALVCFAFCLLNGSVAMLCVRQQSLTRRRLARLAILSIVTFACGAAGQWGLLKTLHSFAPTTDSLQELDLIWMVVLGYATFLAPAAVAWKFVSANRLTKLLAMASESKWIVAPTATMGACSVLTLPFLSVFPRSMVVFIQGAVSALAIGVLCNLLMQHRIHRLGGALAMMVLPAVWAIGLANANESLFWLTGGIGIAFIYFLHIHDSDKPSEDSDQKITANPILLDRLMPTQKLTFEIPMVQEIRRSISSHLQNQSSMAIVVQGNVDAIDNTFDQLGEEHSIDEVLVIRLTGQRSSEPLDPWTQTLEAISPEQKASELSGAWAEIPVDSIASSASLFASQIPFRLPELDVFSLVEDRIVAAMDGCNVVILVSDAGLLDEASLKMISRVRQRLAWQKKGLVIVSDEHLELGDEVQFSRQCFEVPDLTRAEIVHQLTSRLCMDEELADRIVQAVPKTLKDQLLSSLPKSVLEYVAFLESENVLVQDLNVTRLSADIDEDLPIPSSWSKSIGSQIERLNHQQRMCLSLVACFAKPIDSELLRECLRVDEITLLAELHQMVELGLLVERTSEFQYQFASSAILCEARNALGIRDGEQCNLSNLQRELHFRIFQALQNTRHQDILSLARHATAAGVRTAQQAIGLNLAAAQFALQSHSYQLSKKLIHAAAERANTCGTMIDLERHLLMVDMQQSHVQQVRLDETATQAIRLAESCDDLDFVIKAARTCYDASKYESDDKFRIACRELASRVANSHTATRSLRAESMQFLGLADRDRSKRLSRFRDAINQLGHSKEKQDKSLLARFLCSFADELVRQQTDLKTARTHYRRSLRLRIESSIPDENGIARVYGGLGRTEYLSRDYEKALDWFTKDLQIVKKLCDVRRQCMMHSWIGCCLLRDGQLQEAMNAFDLALNMSENKYETFYAVSGLLVTSFQLGNHDRCQTLTEQLLSATGGIEGLQKMIEWSPIARELVDALRETRLPGQTDLAVVKRKRTRPRKRTAA